MSDDVQTETEMTTNDISHPSVRAIEVTASARGTLPVDAVDAALAAIPGFPKALLPGGVSEGVALKRATELVCKGDHTRQTVTTGRKGTAAHSMLALDPSKLDRETSDGEGAASTQLTARIVPLPSGDGFEVKIDPPDHPAAAYIRQQQKDLREVYSATYDLKVWLTTRLLPFCGALKSPDAQGKYLMGKHGNESGVTLLTNVRDALKDVARGGKLRIYMKGVVTGNEDAVDIIQDAMQDEIDRVCGSLEGELNEMDKGAKRVGKRGLATMTEKAHKLRKTLKNLSESYQVGLDDALNGVDELEKRLGMAELALDD